MVKEFKEFISRGNVIDLAVAVVIGAAFGEIINSLVTDLIVPFVGIFMGGHNIVHLTYEVSGVPVHYGKFLNSIVNFLIVAFCLFLVVKTMNAMKKKKEAAPITPNEEIKLLTEIRDLLKK